VLRQRLRGLSTKELVAAAARFRPGDGPEDVGQATSFALRSEVASDSNIYYTARGWPEMACKHGESGNHGSWLRRETLAATYVRRLSPRAAVDEPMRSHLSTERLDPNFERPY
jgi:hypothetical protein